MSKGCATRLFKTSIGVCAILIIGAIFSPVIETLYWHMVNGDQVHYMGRSFRVNLWWTSRIAPAGIFFEKRSLTLLSKQPISAMATIASISRSSNDPTFEETCKTFASVYWNMLVDEKSEVIGPFQFGDGANKCCCMKAISPVNHGRSHIICLVFDGNWSLDFQGNSADEKVIFQETVAVAMP